MSDVFGRGSLLIGAGALVTAAVLTYATSALWPTVEVFITPVVGG